MNRIFSTPCLLLVAGLCVFGTHGLNGQCRFDRAVTVGTGTTDVRGVAVGPDGSVYVTGTFLDSTQIGSTVLYRRFGPVESFLARYTSDLELLWVVDMRGLREVRSVAVDSSGNVFITGWGFGMVIDSTTTLEAAGYHDIFLAKYDTAGRFQWGRKIGGVDLDNGMAVACDNQGGAVVAGSFTGSFIVNSREYISVGRRDIAVAAFDSLGGVRWVQTAGGPGDDVGNAVAVGRDESVYVTGWFDMEARFGKDSVGPMFGHGLYVVRIDSNGRFQWVYAPMSSLSSEGHGITVVPDGSIWVTGWFYETVSDNAQQITSYGQSDPMLMHVDTGGHLLSMRHDGSTEADRGYGISSAADGTLCIGGILETRREPAKFGEHIVPTRGGDAFIAHYDVTGIPECVGVGGDTRYDVGYGVAAGKPGMAYLVGSYSRRALFDTITLISDTSSPGTGFIARARFEADTSAGVSAPGGHHAVRVVELQRGLFLVEGLDAEHADLRVYDLLGRCVYTVEFQAQTNPLRLDLSALPSGVYVVQAAYGRDTPRTFKVRIR